MRRHISWIGMALAILLGVGIHAQNMALEFDGDDCVKIPYTSALDLDDRITVEAWARPAALWGYGPIIRKNIASMMDNYVLRFDGSALEFNINTISASGERNANRFGVDYPFSVLHWYHLAGTFDGENVRIYVNGELIGTRSMPGRLANDQVSTYIGHGDGTWFRGMIDELRIWRVARTEEEIKASMDSTVPPGHADLVAYWTFETIEGQVVEDVTGHGIDGLLGEKPEVGDDDPSHVPSDAPIEVPDPVRVLRVDASATGTADGTSWEAAFPDLRSAIAAALVVTDVEVEIWVAAGTYSVGPERSDTFLVPSGVALFGGFSGEEYDRDDRDPSRNVTVLDGNGVFHAVTCEGEAILDGFTVTGGNADGEDRDGYGGGLHLAGGGASVSRTIIRANRAEGGGGVYVGAGAAPTFTNCLIAECAARNGGGLYCAAGAAPVFLNTTIGVQRASEKGPGLFCEPGAAPGITNSIIWTGGGEALWIEGAEPVISHSCIESAAPWPGDGNIGEDPAYVEPGRFVEESGTWIPGDYSLRPDSPAIDAGLAPNAPGIDLAGVPRPFGAAPDMGAYEVYVAGDFYLTTTDDSAEIGMSLSTQVVLDFDRNEETPPPPPVQAWSYGICHDPTMLSPIAISFDGTDTAGLNGGTGPGFVTARLPAQLAPGPKDGVTVAVVVDLEAPIEALSPRNHWRDAVITYTAVSPLDRCTSAPDGVTTKLVACETLGKPAVRNVLTAEGRSIPLDGFDGATFRLTCISLFQRGDANADGFVDISDPVVILSYQFSGGPIGCQDAGDINDDGQADLADPIQLLNYLFASGPQPAPPFSGCGLDGTADGLTCGAFASCR